MEKPVLKDTGDGNEGKQVREVFDRDFVEDSWTGYTQLLFGINPRTCQQYSLKSQCLADGSKGTGGRRITVKSKKLSSPSTEPQAQATLKPKPVVQSPPVKDNSSKNQPSRPVLWLDLTTTRLRRDLILNPLGKGNV